VRRLASIVQPAKSRIRISGPDSRSRRIITWKTAVFLTIVANERFTKNHGSILESSAGGALDLVSLGAVVHRLDPGVIPFRKAVECRIHVSGGEFNVAANLADCFGLRTAIVTAMADYPIGDLIAERVRAMGVKPFYKHFAHDGVTGPNMATVFSDRGLGARARWFSITAATKPRAV